MTTRTAVAVADRPRAGRPAAWWQARAWRAWCVVVAAVLQVGFLLELVLPGEPDPLRSQISELSAPSQPGELLFRALDVISGLLVLAVVPGWWRAHRVVGGCLAAWGGGLAVAAVWSASCADSLDKGCDGNGLPGLHTSFRNNMHDIGSIVSVLALLAGIVVAGVFLRRVQARGGVGRTWGTAVLVLGTTCWLLGAFETTEDVFGVDPVRGVSQRMQVVLLSVVLVLLADPGRWPRAGAAPGQQLSPEESSPSGS